MLYLLRVELGQHDAGGPDPQRAQELVHDAMNMVKGQSVENHIVSAPGPFTHQTLNLREREECLYRRLLCDISTPSLLLILSRSFISHKYTEL